jgi:hypothetical protein
MVITSINPSEIVVMFTNLAIFGAPHSSYGSVPAAPKKKQETDSGVHP